MEIDKNKCIGIIGKIGSGKSTLARAIVKLIPVHKGKITINDIDIDKIPTCKLRKMISYIPQQARLFNRTLYENITYGISISRSKFKDEIEKYNIRSLFINFDDKLDKKIGKNGSKLSGGQKQIVQIVRAILKKSQVIILDEPTNSLDIKSREYIHKLIKLIKKNTTVIIITHDLDMLPTFDKVYTINDDGYVVSRGEDINNNTAITNSGFVSNKR